MQSLDPRVRRLGIDHGPQEAFKSQGPELIAFEIFWQGKQGKPYEHVGIVHAADAQLAMVYGKEQYSRRGGTCFGIKAVETAKVVISDTVDADLNAFDYMPDLQYFDRQAFEVYILKKRGKHHMYAGQVAGNGISGQLEALRTSPALSVWLVPAEAISQITYEEGDIWQTLPDKQYRDAVAYKSADRIAAYKAGNQAS